jgi:hypothetical protein
MRRDYSKQSIDPGLRRNQSYIEMMSMHSMKQQFYTEDYGNDEFYSNLEEEYFQKVVLKNKNRKRK